MAKKAESPRTKNIKAALAMYEIGWIPFPLLPDSTVLAVDFDEWQDKLSTNGIRRYWRDHPDHGLGFIEGDKPTQTHIFLPPRR